ncbi:MAG: hypothetical protein JWM16_6446 [Verrucomicrobiales bacterium]|nr:hypothetical protein [Verrucomicrobiales bacterium]
MTKRPTKSADGRVFDSMAQASGVLNISKDTLAELKAKGCPAFRGSRIHEAELLAYLRDYKHNTAPGTLADHWEDISKAGLGFGCRLLLTLDHPSYGKINRHYLALNKHLNEIALLVGARTQQDFEPVDE